MVHTSLISLLGRQRQDLNGFKDSLVNIMSYRTTWRDSCFKN